MISFTFLLSFFFSLIPSESTYRHQATIDDEVVTMEILDTAGQVNKQGFFSSNEMCKWTKDIFL